MREDITIGGGFALQKMSISSTTVALNVEKDKDLLLINPRSVDMR